MKKIILIAVAALFIAGIAFAAEGGSTEEAVQQTQQQEPQQQELQSKDEIKNLQQQEFQKKFDWWPTDATPGPVEDKVEGGYWWWPTQPGPKSGKVWGNRGWVYVRKLIFDYQEDELPPPKPQELRPSLLIKKIIKNVKVYFDYDKSDIRDDAGQALEAAVGTLRRSPECSILVTGNCDARGTEKYNDKLGKQRGLAVKGFLKDKGVQEERIKIVSRGKLDAIAPVTDLVGMAKDRNAQFMVAEIEEVMLPYQGEAPAEVPAGAQKVEEGMYVEQAEEMVEGEIKVTTKDYTIQPGDSLWKIAQKELGSGHRWQYLYNLNKDRIKDPQKLKAGTKIVIPIE